MLYLYIMLDREIQICFAGRKTSTDKIPINTHFHAFDKMLLMAINRNVNKKRYL